MSNFLTDEQVIVLKQAHRTIKDKKLADRIKTILSLNSGFGYDQVAQTLLLDKITLRRYVEKFQKRVSTDYWSLDTPEVKPGLP